MIRCALLKWNSKLYSSMKGEEIWSTWRFGMISLSLKFLFVWWPSSTSIRSLAASLGYTWWNYNLTLLECLVSHLEYLAILSFECSSIPYPSISSTFVLYVFQFLSNFQALSGSFGAFKILSNFYVPSGTLWTFRILINFYASSGNLRVFKILSNFYDPNGGLQVLKILSNFYSPTGGLQVFKILSNF